jgi:tRNA(Ile)-lysidine synthase
VAAQAQMWGLPHETLLWRGWDGAGNLQDTARRARYRLLTQWAEAHGIEAIALGHTADDQAETVLMRLARASGVSGLSAMASVRWENGVRLVRPMLSITRERLRDYLKATGISWIEDPSNHDQRFDRIKTREALSGLQKIGITAETLSRVAGNLTQAREALAQYAQESARKVVQVDDGDLCIDRTGFAALPEEIRRRVLVSAIGWVASNEYAPRQSAVEQGIAAILSGQTTTVGGCLLLAKAGKTWVCRELSAIDKESAEPGMLWDHRWRLTGPAIPGTQIRALADHGIRQLEDWRNSGKPRAVLAATPAVWIENTLIAAPLAGFSNQWTAELSNECPEYYTSILSH